MPGHRMITRVRKDKSPYSWCLHLPGSHLTLYETVTVSHDLSSLWQRPLHICHWKPAMARPIRPHALLLSYRRQIRPLSGPRPDPSMPTRTLPFSTPSASRPSSRRPVNSSGPSLVLVGRPALPGIDIQAIEAQPRPSQRRSGRKPACRFPAPAPYRESLICGAESRL